MAANPRVVVEFIADTTKFAKGISEGFDEVGKSADKSGKLDWKSLENWGAAAASIAAGAAMVTSAAKATTKLATETMVLQRATGMEAETASAWVQLLGARNIGTDAFARSVAKLSRDMVDWTKGGEESNSMLKEMGVSFETVASGDVDQVILQVADAFKAMTSPAEKADAATRLFGRSGLKLIPILSLGSEGIKDQLKMYQDYGATVDQEGVNSVKAMIGAQREVDAAHQGVVTTIGSALLPVQARLWEATAKLVAVFQPLLADSDALTLVVAAMAGSFILAKAAIAVTTTITEAHAAATAISTAATKLWTIAQKALNRSMFLWIAIAAAVALAIWLIITYADEIVAAWNWAKDIVGKAFDWIKQAAEKCWNWIKEHWPELLAILTGPIGIAVLVISRHWDQIKAAAVRCTEGIKSAWSSFTSWFSGITSKIGSMLSKLGDMFKKPIEGAKAAYEGVKNWIGKIPDYISSIVGKVSSAASKVANAIKAPINSVIGAWNRLSFNIPSFSIPAFELPGGKKVGGQSFGGKHISFPSIPMLARGGVLDSPTLFLGGENGREIVTPETLLRDILGEFMGKGGRQYTLNLSTTRADSADVQHGFRRMELLGGR